MRDITIKVACNGFIVRYNGNISEDFCEEDWLASDIGEVCELVQTFLQEEIESVDMSNVVTDTLPNA